MTQFTANTIKKLRPLSDSLIVNGKHIMLFNRRDPRELPWKECGIDIVVEATGKFNSKEKAMSHIEAGAKKSF